MSAPFVDRRRSVLLPPREVVTVLALLLATIVVLSWVAGEGTNPAATSRTPIHGETVWYRERPEPERPFRGILCQQTAPAGPASRDALRYTLVTVSTALPIYAPGDGDELAPFAGRLIEASGKVIDLGAEGFGRELWIGEVSPLRLRLPGLQSVLFGLCSASVSSDQRGRSALPISS